MELTNRSMPALMQKLHELPYGYSESEAIEFEPYKEFLSAEDTQHWFEAWTGNAAVDGSAYLVFGQDGTGGYAAIWLQRETENLLEQPIVFLGSEGEMGVIAQNFSDYLWLLAGGHGPYEAVAYPDDGRTSDSLFVEFAWQYATTPQNKSSEIIAKARLEFPDFNENILAMCR